MSLADVTPIADALLYEGYLLYPYRQSSVKNRQRFNFGVLYPAADAERLGGNERASVQTECLLEGDEATGVDVHVRFLHLNMRHSHAVGALPPWQEAVSREVAVSGTTLGALFTSPLEHRFVFAAIESAETERDGSIVVRRQEAVSGTVTLAAIALGRGLTQLRCTVTNTSASAGPTSDRDTALMRALVSAHTAFVARNGAFISLLEPPERCQSAAAACENIGTWPVLVGKAGSTDTMLSSPIILYDYPEVAPESPGDLFDGAEIDEILSLRIMTLTDEEKREMAMTDARARMILERTSALDANDMMRLHGVMRSAGASEGAP